MHNTVSGETASVLQAGKITGDVHLHAPATGIQRPRPAPRPIVEWNPFDLGVHKAITVPEGADGHPLPDLPGYLRRAHDSHLDDLLGDLSQNVMVVLTGESSTGKTRALHEAISAHEVLRAWPLWYPRTADELLVLAESGEIVAETVLWLNETHNHLSGPTGDLAAAALRSLLDGSRGGPLVVVGTLWPQFLAEFVAQPRSGQRDESANARSLLQQRARRIRVAERFSKQEISALRTSSAVDPRLTAAVAASGEDRQIIQTMAGGPALVERYEFPDDADSRYAAAILSAAIDARRLGHLQPIPRALLADAAAGYLGNQDRVDPPSDWFTRGMARAAGQAVLGVTALTARRHQPGTGPADGYELHDYLDQHGRTTRQSCPAPPAQWEACATHASHPEDLVRLTKSAYHRLLYRYADPLLEKAVQVADNDSLNNLVDVLSEYGRVEQAIRFLPSHEGTGGVWNPYTFTPERPHQSTVQALIDHGRTEEAEKLLEAFLSSGLGAPWCWKMLTDLLVDLNRTDDAISLLRRLCEQRDDEEGESSPGDDVTTQHAVEAKLPRSWLHNNVAWRLACMLADQGLWDQALEIIRTASADTARHWLAKRFDGAGRIDRLRALADVGDAKVSVTLVEALLERGQVAEGVALYRSTSPGDRPSPRLFELLVRHGELDLAIEVAGGHVPHSPDESLLALAAALTAHGHQERLIPLLRELAADAPTERFEPRDHSSLADLLVSQGCWEDALDLARRNPAWAQRWVPKQLAEAGNTEKLLFLAEIGNESAGRELARLLVRRSKRQEALEILRRFADSGADWASDELAALLNEIHRLDELISRAAGGDRHASLRLVVMASRKEIAGAEQLLRLGLSPNGEFPARDHEL